MLPCEENLRTLASVYRHRNYWHEPNIGAPGAPTRCCICGCRIQSRRISHQPRRFAMRLLLDTYTSPLCPLLLVTDEQGVLRALEFGDQQNRLHRFLRAHCGNYELEDGAAPDSITDALNAYFDGDLRLLDAV